MSRPSSRAISSTAGAIDAAVHREQPRVHRREPALRARRRARPRRRACCPRRAAACGGPSGSGRDTAARAGRACPARGCSSRTRSRSTRRSSPARPPVPRSGRRAARHLVDRRRIEAIGVRRAYAHGREQQQRNAHARSCSSTRTQQPAQPARSRPASRPSPGHARSSMRRWSRGITSNRSAHSTMHDAAGIAEHLVEPELGQLGRALDPVQVDVPHAQPAAADTR